MRWKTPLLLSLLIICLLFSPTVSYASIISTNLHPTNEITQSYDFQSSKSFTKNVGQIQNDEILYTLRIPGGIIGFESSCIRIRSIDMNQDFRLSFLNSNTVFPTMVDSDTIKTTYISKNRIETYNIPSLKKLFYNNLWAGIDLIFEPNSDGVKYSFLVEPGANPSDIQLKCEDQEIVECTGGGVKMRYDSISIIDEGLYIHQGMNQISGNYIQLSDDTYGFAIDEYDTSSNLIIDPLIYSTFVGGDEQDEANGMTIDEEGYAYVTGLTWSYDFPIQNPFIGKYVGFHYDCFLFKLHPDGNRIEYSTYITGGAGFNGLSDDIGTAVAVDSSGNAYITGFTEAVDLPMVNSYNNIHSGGELDGFLMKINATGNGLVYSTYLGGSDVDWPNDIVVDEQNNVYITGFTSSSDFPVNKGYSSSIDSSGSCFVTKFHSSGQYLLFSTFFGGSGIDQSNAIALDSNNQVTICGFTTSVDLPMALGIDNTYNGEGDAFIASFSPDGATLRMATYVGGTSRDSGDAITIDSDRNVILGGYTMSDDLPVAGGYGSSYNGKKDCFILKMNGYYSKMFLSYIGGSDNDKIEDLTTYDGDIFVCGHSVSHDFPTTPLIGEVYDGLTDCIIFQISGDGKSLLASGYLGGSDIDFAVSIVVDRAGTIYITGVTSSIDFDTVNAFDYSFNSLPEIGWGTDIFVSRFYNTIDSDNDFMADTWEEENNLLVGVNDSFDDPDGDNIPNIFEYGNYTDPQSNDSDYDLCPDLWEIMNGLNPLNFTDGSDDFDNDELTNYEEYIVNTNPHLNDSDFDLCPDGWEVNFGLDPLIDDSEQDLDSDGLTNLEEWRYGTYPDLADSDEDGWNDYDEIEFGCNPLVNDLLCHYYPILIIGFTFGIILLVFCLIYRLTIIEK
ncbi:MAG: exported protein of unknown function [Candidatus Thorarchaeota archaeon]|nr:MAG: exported protein of unknown function [Candidatus Thorarchaeota archaeon]